MLNVIEEKSSNLKSVIWPKYDFEPDKIGKLLFKILVSNINQNWKQEKKEQPTNLTNIAKQAKFFNKIFDYIYGAKCWRFFGLA